jgi:hypothetical protein
MQTADGRGQRGEGRRQTADGRQQTADSKRGAIEGDARSQMVSGSRKRGCFLEGGRREGGAERRQVRWD